MNIQINNVVHVQCDCSHQPRVSHDQSGEWGAIALFAGQCLVKFVVGVMLAVGGVVWWLTCRTARGVLEIDQRYGSGEHVVVRALGPGVRVNEIETTEMVTYAED